MDTIDDVLGNGDQCQPKRSDIKEDIFSLPFLADEDHGNHFYVIGADYPEYVQPSEELNRFQTQSSRGNPLLQDKDFEVPGTICSSDYTEWLQEKAASFMTTKNRSLTCKLLVKLAGDLKVIPPRMIAISGCDLHQMAMERSCSWMDSLILEMRTVEETFSSEVRDSGVFVLTSRPYPALLRELAEAVMKNGPQSQNRLFDEGKQELPINLSSTEYVEWLETNTSFIGKLITKQQAPSSSHTAQTRQSAVRILLKLAEDLEYLRPGNESHLGYNIKMALWRVYWNELIAEMKTVEARCSSETRFSGVYVLTTWPYRDFLRILAGKLPEMSV